MAINAANDTNNDNDRATIQKEFTQRMANINDIATTTNYNGKTLLDGTYSKAGFIESKVEFEPILISAGDYAIESNGVYILAKNYTDTVTINAKNVKLTQEDPTTTLNNVSIVGNRDGNQNVWIEDLNIFNSAEYNKSVIKFQGSGNYLTVKGTNIFNNIPEWDDGIQNYYVQQSYSGKYYEKAAVNSGQGLAIVGDGNLSASAYRGAAIGGDFQGSAGNIIIGGDVNVKVDTISGAGIGSGSNGNAGDIIIGENVTFTAKSSAGALIGSGNDSATVGNIIIGGNSKITGKTHGGGAGVGSGYSRSNAGNITIGNNAVINIENNGATGIGAGAQSSVGNISIVNSAVIDCHISSYGSRIGSGVSNAYASSAGNIIIGGNANITVEAQLGAGIGTGGSHVRGCIHKEKKLNCGYEKRYLKQKSISD